MLKLKEGLFSLFVFNIMIHVSLVCSTKKNYAELIFVHSNYNTLE
jgi:hypothetical protein